MILPEFVPQDIIEVQLVRRIIGFIIFQSFWIFGIYYTKITFMCRPAIKNFVCFLTLNNTCNVLFWGCFFLQKGFYFMVVIFVIILIFCLKTCAVLLAEVDVTRFFLLNVMYQFMYSPPPICFFEI
jgi:hypothetical protein